MKIILQKYVCTVFTREIEHLYSYQTVAVMPSSICSLVLFVHVLFVLFFICLISGISQENPNTVVIGLAPECFNYVDMNRAFRYQIISIKMRKYSMALSQPVRFRRRRLNNQIYKCICDLSSTLIVSTRSYLSLLIFGYRLLLDGGQLIAIHKARYYKTKDGLNLGPGMNCSQTLQLAHKNNQQAVQATSFFVLNFRHVCLFYSQSQNHFSGPFVTGLEYATDVKAHVVGKPEKTFFLEAMKSFTCEPHETVMIGDVS